MATSPKSTHRPGFCDLSSVPFQHSAAWGDFELGSSLDEPCLGPGVVLEESQQLLGDFACAVLSRGMHTVVGEVLALPDQAVCCSGLDAIGSEVRTPEHDRLTSIHSGPVKDQATQGKGRLIGIRLGVERRQCVPAVGSAREVDQPEIRKFRLEFLNDNLKIRPECINVDRILAEPARMRDR